MVRLTQLVVRKKPGRSARGKALTLYKAPSRKPLVRTVKKIVRNQLLTPKTYHSSVHVRSPTFHNIMESVDLLRDIVPGHNEDEREGDSIYVKNIIIKGQIETNTTHIHRLGFRLMVFKHRAKSSGTGLQEDFSFADILMNGNSANTLVEPWDPNKCTVLYDRVHTVTPAISGQKNFKTFQIVLRNVGKYVYDDSSGYSLGRDYGIYFVYIPYIVGGTAGSTDMGPIVFNHTVKFTDGK